MSVLVCGSGPGGMAIAAHLAEAGREVTVADLPAFPQHVRAIADRGGVEVRSSWTGSTLVPVAATHEVAAAVAAADLVIVSVPASAHERWVAEVAPSLRDDATLLFMGEGSGSLVARRAFLGDGCPDVLVAETNCLPLIGRVAGPGAVTGDRKSGGVLLAAIPASRTTEVLRQIHDVWPFVEGADSVFETTLVNYDAIDTVPVALVNAGVIEGRGGGLLLWGEGATRSVVRVVETLDAELFSLRRSLGGRDPRRYRDFLIAQGLAPDVGDLFDSHAGGRDRSQRPAERHVGRRGAAPLLGGGVLARARVVDRRSGRGGHASDRRDDRRGRSDAGPKPQGRGAFAGVPGTRRARRTRAPFERDLMRRGRVHAASALSSTSHFRYSSETLSTPRMWSSAERSIGSSSGRCDSATGRSWLTMSCWNSMYVVSSPSRS